MPLHLSFFKSNPEITVSAYMIYSFRPYPAPGVHGRALELGIATYFEASHTAVLTGGGQWEIEAEGGGGRCCLDNKLCL